MITECQPVHLRSFNFSTKTRSLKTDIPEGNWLKCCKLQTVLKESHLQRNISALNICLKLTFKIDVTGD